MDQPMSSVIGGEYARAFVEVAYGSRGDNESVDHPLAVARLLDEDGQRPSLILAGLLHDVLEDTDVTANDLLARFGSEVTRLVEALTEDPSIAAYTDRKAVLRRQILDAGRDAATIALADKAAKLASQRSRPRDRQLEHYRATLQGIEKRYGRSRLSETMCGLLERFGAET